MIQKVDHIGIAVRSLADTIPYYENALGMKLLKAGETHVELLEATSEESPIAKFIAKNGEGIHHVAFGTDDITGQLKQAADAGVKLIHEVPMIGAGGKQVAFLHPKFTHGVLTEFCSGGEH